MSDLEIELYDNPAPVRPGFGPEATPLSRALQAISAAPDLASLSLAIAPCKAWPEGPDRVKAREALAKRLAELTPISLPGALPPSGAGMPVIRINGALPTTTPPVTAGAPPPSGYPYGQPNRAPDGGDGGSMVSAVPTSPGRDIFAQRRVAAGLSETARMSRPLPTVLPPTRTEVKQAISAREIVVGAKEEGSGILTGWAGSGELTRAQILAALAGSGYPEAWAPAPKSDHFHASAALLTLTQQGRILRSERGRFQQVAIGQGAEGPYRRYTARWTIGDPTHGQVGETFGLTVLTAGLTAGGALDLAGDAGLIARVREEYSRRQGEGGVYPAGEVTEWLRTALIYRFSAVRLGANWYIPHAHAESAERLLCAISVLWGQAWILPALPVATTAQLQSGIVRGLSGEAEAVLAEFDTQRAVARADRPGSDIGPKSAATLIGKLRDVYVRAKEYAVLLGPDSTKKIRARLEAALAVIEPLCDDSVQRFALLDLK
jgi:hypothetical protein